MRKSILRNLLLAGGISVTILQSCKDDSNLAASLPIPDQSFVEEFDTLQAAQSKGWLTRNRSEPIGRGVWTQGMTGNQAVAIDITAYSSKSTNLGFISCDYTSCHQTNPGEGTISNWVISPAVTMQNGDRIIFYTRTNDTIARWGDRIQLLINRKNDGIECGRGMTTGDFDVTLVDVNPFNVSGRTDPVPTAQAFPFPYTAAPPYPVAYDNINRFPVQWTRFEGTVAGLTGPHKGRFALRYFVPFGGDQGRGDHISIDSVAYVSVSRK